MQEALQPISETTEMGDMSSQACGCHITITCIVLIYQVELQGKNTVSLRIR